VAAGDAAEGVGADHDGDTEGQADRGDLEAPGRLPGVGGAGDDRDD
jgi:hypothetical protein